jgi:hypothetical protein
VSGRALGIAAVVLVSMPSHVSADGYGFLRFSGGAALPLGDHTWRQSAGVSPKLGVGVGGVVGTVGAMFTADATLIRLAEDEDLFAMGTSNETMRRARLLGHVSYDRRNVGDPRVALVFRGGVGADIAFASYDRFSGGTNYPKSLTKVGLALELAAAAYVELGPGVHLGGELAVPISRYASETAPGGATGFRYTSVDLDVLVTVRFTSTSY